MEFGLIFPHFLIAYYSIKIDKKQCYTREVVKKFLASLLWCWLASVVVFVASGVFLLNLQHPQLFVAFKTPQAQAIIAGRFILQNGQAIDASVESGDARAQIIANFLNRYNSPMQPAAEYGKKLVEIADHYGIDFRLLPAIAMQESNLCKTTNPGAPHNCLGFGIHKSGTLDFDSYEEGFDRAGRELKTRYIDQGLTTVESIESKYTPSSNGSWANSVNQWMSEMRYDDRQLGRENNTNTNASEFAREQ